VFACVTGAGELEGFDLNFDTEVPIARVGPNRGKGRSLLGEELEQMRMEGEKGRLDSVGQCIRGRARIEWWE
jgi:hypothetical protein